MFNPMITKCKIHGINVEQEIWYHCSGAVGFSYSCGCTSEHTKDLSSWKSEDGKVLDIDETEK